MYAFQRALKKYHWQYLFVLPMFALFLVFTVYPLLDSVRYTFYDWNGIGAPQDFVGFKHYINITNDFFFWNAFKNTFIYTAVLVPIQLMLALVLAVILNSRKLKAKYAFRGIFFSPVVTPPAIVGVVFVLLINTASVDINKWLISLGLLKRPIDVIGDPRMALWVIIAIGVWIGLGYPMLYFLAALQSINQDLYDAARVDGAGNVASFWYITLPMIRPIAVIVFLITTLHSLRVFDMVQVMTRGGPYFATEVVGTYIYRYAFRINAVGDSDAALGYASAAAFYMGMIVMIISLLQLFAVRYATRQRKQNRDESDETQ
jgi:ABC-type sugar transport system permease subunit